MSMESAELFIDRMNCDEVFAEQVMDCKNSYDRMSFVKKNGFSFNPSEVKLIGDKLHKDDIVMRSLCKIDQESCGRSSACI